MRTQHLSNFPTAIPLWTGGVYSIICWLLSPCCFHDITSLPPETPWTCRPLEVNLLFYWLDLWFHGRSIIFPLCGLVCFEVLCALAEDHPALVAHLQHQLCCISPSQLQMLPINLAQCPALRARSLQHRSYLVLVFPLSRNAGKSFCRLQPAWLLRKAQGPVIS